MINSLSKLFDNDTESRLRIDQRSMLITLVLGVLCRFTGASNEDIPKITLIVAFIAYGVQLAIYVAFANPRRAPERKPPTYGLLTYGLAALTICAAIIWVSVPKVEAAIFADTLHAVATAPPSDSRTKKMDRLLSLAKSENLSVAGLSLVSNSDEFDPSLPSIESLALEAQPKGALTDFDRLILNANSVLPKGTTTFVNSAYRPAGESAEFYLDGIRFIDVHFANGVIEYDGGPLDLHRVSIRNCLFVVSDKPAARLLVEAIIAANGGPVTLHAGGK